MKELFSAENIKRILKYLLYMFLTLVTQNMLFTQVRPLGVAPMVLPAAVVAVGMFEGATWGAAFGVVMGIFADMAFVENTILFTVLFPLIAFGTGFVTQFFINRRFFAYMGATLAALLITALTQMELVILRDAWSPQMISTVLLQTLWSLPPAVLAYFPPAEWIE